MSGRGNRSGPGAGHDVTTVRGCYEEVMRMAMNETLVFGDVENGHEIRLAVRNERYGDGHEGDDERSSGVW